MMIPWELALSFVIGLVLLYLLSYLLLVPMRFLWRLMAGSLLGALSMFLVNQFSYVTGFVVPVNVFTVLMAGFLGLPGVGLSVALTLLL